MSTIHIYHIITSLDTGGAETMLAKLIEITDLARFRVTVVVLKDRGELAPRIERAGADVITFDMNGAKDLVKAILKLKSLLQADNPNIVQTWLYHADFVGTVAAKLAGVSPILWNLRCSKVDFSKYNFSTRIVFMLLTLMSSIPKVAVSNSYAGRDAHVDLGYRIKNWQIIPNGFDTTKFVPDESHASAFRNSLGVDKYTRLIGLPARFDPMKGHEIFFEAASILAAELSDVAFVLVGKGVDAEDVIERVNYWGLRDRIHLLGERSDMHVVMAGLDIVTLCSLYGEGFPNVLGEALSSGAMCVATDVGDSARLLGRWGKVIPVGEPLALAFACRELLELSTAQRTSLVKAGRQHIIQNYSLPAVGAMYMHLYSSVIGEKVGGNPV